ncbi:MAG TPA: PilZ domain-containing protein [Nitrospiria bacterium]|nr:PilZ domain-containing protein [Nitrospiria bacterium]
MKTMTANAAARTPEPWTHAIVIHFQDGRIDRGVLTSSLFSGTTLTYRPNLVTGERRTVVRVPLLTEAKIDRLTVGRVTDVSAQGAFVETLAPYPIGTALTISLRIDNELINAPARVVFSDPGVGMGLEFTRPSTAEWNRVDAALHRLVRGERTQSAGRRRDANRRTGRGAPAGPRRWDARHRDRRHVAQPETAAPIMVDLAKVKSVFFIESNDQPRNGNSGGDPLDREVTVEFRDGEMIHGTMGELDSDAPGFFVALRLDEQHTHTVYVVKSAVKSIQTAF